jgi:hypothetical protein
MVQSTMLVFDRQGKVIDALEREQFELLVDGQPRPILFFERVRAGSPREEAQLAAVGGASVPASSPAPDRGRTV